SYRLSRIAKSLPKNREGFSFLAIPCNGDSIKTKVFGEERGRFGGGRRAFLKKGPPSPSKLFV
ncbi:MAG: hypothetical protein ACLS73_16875, partial [Bilophila wadsworthia]